MNNSIVLKIELGIVSSLRIEHELVVGALMLVVTNSKISYKNVLRI